MPGAIKYQDFRYFASAAIGMTANDNGVKLRFGIEEIPGEIIDQVGIVMTLKTLKILHHIVNGLFLQLEKQGVIISVDEANLKQLEEAFNAKSENQN